MAEIPLEPPSRSLKGKVAIVTGAGSPCGGIGNGRAIAILLADDGCDVVCVDQQLDRCEETVTMIRSKEGRGKSLAMYGDVTSAADCASFVDLTLKSFGRLDILVNNVGIGGAPGTAIDVDMEAWAQGLEVNITSMVLMAKFAIPAMLKNTGDEIKGSIVNMGSVAGVRGGTPHLLYPTSKGAVVNMTRAMAAHHAQDGIRVNCVCPGVSSVRFRHKPLYLSNTYAQMLYTPMMYEKGMSEEARAARKARSLLGTEGTGWDAACAAVFLAGPHARWITGIVMPVDAGTTAATSINMPKGASVGA